MRGRGNKRLTPTTSSSNTPTFDHPASADHRIENPRRPHPGPFHDLLGLDARAMPAGQHEQGVEPEVRTAADAALQIVVDDERPRRRGPERDADAAQRQIEDGPMRFAKPGDRDTE